MAEVERWTAMTRAPQDSEPQSLYELSWTYAPGSMFAFDAVTGQLININPAAEALSGYSRAELVGKNITLLHPKDERKRVRAEFLNVEQQPSRYSGYHIQHKDGRLLPVMISSSKTSLVDDRHVAIYAYFNITDQVENEHRLSSQNWALSAYAHAALALGQVHSNEDLLLTAICKAITQGSVYLLAWVGITEDGPGKPIRIAAAAGSAAKYIDGLHLSWSEDEPMGQGPTGRCIRTQQVQIVEDSESSAIFSPFRERARQYGIRSSVSIPIAADGNLRGALMVYAAYPNAFEPLAINVFLHLAEQINLGLHAIQQERLLVAERQQRASIQMQLTEAMSAMVAPIVLAMEMRDPYTVGHQSRVADIAVAIGRDLGWTEERLQGLRMAALIHDIGKISIPSEILTKPVELSAAEREIIKAHPETGYFILKDIPFAWPVAEMVRQHHEKLDGSGYPRGLKADEILPEAKVLAVADMVEAMTCYRPYRPGMKIRTVLEEVQRIAGTMLDEEVVRVCVALFREKHFTVPGWARS
jgi:PAS domain S-box-containing protein/putative nucleotidyltransferase with HDIG domain